MMQPLEDEGVIESTLKKAAEDIQQIFAEDKNTEKDGRREMNPYSIRKSFLERNPRKASL